MTTKETVDDAVRDEPVYWFSVLDHALIAGNLDLAAQAHRELRRLGVEVKFPRKRAHQVGGAAHA